MRSPAFDRRTFLQMTATLAAGYAAPSIAAQTQAQARERILVVVELSGGNDGLNCVAPFGDDAYYRQRPNLGIRQEHLLRLDDHFGLNPGMTGMHRLWQDGQLAIIHGCGYNDPSFSHFTSMAYWQTASPNSGNPYGWIGRLADAMQPEPTSNYIINIDAAQSLAVSSRVHSPVVFDDPMRFERRGFAGTRQALADAPQTATGNPSRDWLRGVAKSARDGSALIRAACSSYQPAADYGIAPMDLDKVSACIAADLPARFYYVAFRNNAFDTHVQQADLHQRLLTYASDAITGFIRDLEQQGQADRVVVLAFSEFGRRVPENANLGTDHGAAGPMFIVGAPVKGGHYGDLPSLTELDAGDNLVPTTDFRRVYATAVEGWMAPGRSTAVLGGNFAAFPVFG